MNRNLKAATTINCCQHLTRILACSILSLTYVSARAQRDQRNACLRRLDGEPFRMKGNPKALAEAEGERWHWPIGLDEIVRSNRKDVLLCEGAPDGLAALHLAIESGKKQVGVAVLLGEGANISPDARRLFVGRRVRICADATESGMLA